MNPKKCYQIYKKTNSANVFPVIIPIALDIIQLEYDYDQNYDYDNQKPEDYTDDYSQELNEQDHTYK